MGGWIVAIVVAVYSLWHSRLYQEKDQRRERQRDFLASVYQPLHEELESLLAWENRGREGYLIWQSPGTEFLKLVSQGVLFQPALRPLREDIGALRQAHEEYEQAYWELSRAVEKAISETWMKILIEIGQGAWSEEILGYMLQPRQTAIDGLWSSLFVGDDKSFEHVMVEALARLQSKGAPYPSKPIRELYAEARSTIQPLKRTHDEKLAGFLHAAKSVRKTLEQRISEV